MIAEIVVRNSHLEFLDYAVPPELASKAVQGAFAVVPLGEAFTVGVIWRLKPQSDLAGIKPIHSVLADPAPIDPTHLKFIGWVADYYLCPLSKALFSALPFASGTQAKHCYQLEESHALFHGLSDYEKSQLRTFVEGSGKSGSKLSRELDFYRRAGLLKKMPFFDLPTDRSDKRSSRNKKIPNKTDEAASPPELTAEQAQALAAIVPTVQARQFSCFLLQGVTGSGKTEVYIRAAEEAVKLGLEVLVLIPEISLTPQSLHVFSGRFSCPLFLRHSGITKRQSTVDWLNIRKDGPKIIIGTRSAVFAPFSRLGLVIVDEEHDASYKQQDIEPYYSARDSAVKLANLHGCPVVLGSATPAVESRRNAETGKFSLLRMSSRPGAATAELRVELVNPKDEPAPTGLFYLSAKLEASLRRNLAAGHQSILFVNRRGYARFLLCGSCKTPVYCRNCSIPYTLAMRPERLVCHHCGQQAPVPSGCPACKAEALSRIGFGTERIEQDMAAMFPKARVLRIDSETVNSANKWQDVHSRIMKGEADIIIGTQMITKGHDFPNIALVAVLLPDLGLSYPDFRSAERVFQLLVQVSGRTGRSGLTSGEVIIQTYNKQNPVISLAAAGDYEGFYAYESAKREALGFPPFGRAALMTYHDSDENRTYDAVIRLHERMGQLSARFGVELLGPVESPLYKINNRFYWQWAVKATTHQQLRQLGLHVIKLAAQAKLAGKLKFIVDPMSL